MRIGIDIRALMEPQYSGVPEYTKNIIQAVLEREKNGGNILGYKKNQYKLFYNSASDVKKNIPEFNYENTEVIKTNYPNKIFNNFMQGIADRPKIDRLLNVDLFFMPNIGFISLSSQCQKIITIHDLSFLRYPGFFSFKRRLWHKLINVKKLIKKFDKIVAVSENTKLDIVEICGVAEEKIKVIHSGISPEFRHLDKDDKKLQEVKEKYHLPDRFIFFLGTLEPRKNVEGVIKAYNNLRNDPRFSDVKLVLAGSQGWQIKNIYNEWKKSKHKKDIRFLGYVEKNDKIYLYNLASVFVYPSFYEGFGFPPLEAMACGTPVITSQASSMPEIVQNGAILVNPFDFGDISDAILILLENDQVKDNLIPVAEKIAKKFTWEKASGEYLSFWQQ